MASHRITDKDLQAVVDRINRITGSPMHPWTTLPDGRHASVIGNFHIDHAYGGVALHRMANTAGAVNDVLRIGHVTKSALRDAMFAFIEGINIGRECASRT